MGLDMCYKKGYVKLLWLAILVVLSGCSGNKAKNADDAGATEYYTMSDFQALPKVDIHVHINVEKHAIIEEARANNFRMLVMAVDVVPEYPPMEEQLRVRQNLHQENPDVFAYATAFTLDGWDEPGWSDQVIKKLAEDFDKGALGVKVWKNIGMEAKDKEGNLITLDDPKFDPIFDYVKAQNKVLLSHAGEPKNCWLPVEEMTVNNDRDYFSKHPQYHMYLHPELPAYEDHIEARNNMLEKHRDITFIGVHFATLEWSVKEIGAFLDRFPNAYVDCAERLSHLQVQTQKNRKEVREFFIKYQERILYGTDFQELEYTDPSDLKEHMHTTWMNDWKYLVTDEVMEVGWVNGSFQGLKLPKEVIDKIYQINAEKIFPTAWDVTEE